MMDDQLQDEDRQSGKHYFRAGSVELWGSASPLVTHKDCLGHLMSPKLFHRHQTRITNETTKTHWVSKYLWHEQSTPHVTKPPDQMLHYRRCG